LDAIAPTTTRKKRRFQLFLTIAQAEKKPKACASEGRSESSSKTICSAILRLSTLDRSWASLSALKQHFGGAGGDGKKRSGPAVELHGSKPSFLKAIPEAFLIRFAHLVRNKYGQFVEEKQVAAVCSLAPKIAFTVENGFPFLSFASVWDAYNEGGDPLAQQKYKKRDNGCYQSGHLAADRIYINRENRHFA